MNELPQSQTVHVQSHRERETLANHTRHSVSLWRMHVSLHRRVRYPGFTTREPGDVFLIGARKKKWRRESRWEPHLINAPTLWMSFYSFNSLCLTLCRAPSVLFFSTKNWEYPTHKELAGKAPVWGEGCSHPPGRLQSGETDPRIYVFHRGGL